MKSIFVFLPVWLFTSAACAGGEGAINPVDGNLYEGWYISRIDGPALQLSETARGPECPTGSGTWCGDEYNHCCLIKGEWTCVVELKDCKDE
jgi:hypothetical protein